eukprot:COSAG02_NODE_664_length_18739_cov_11.071567_24_plen_300_part_00
MGGVGGGEGGCRRENEVFTYVAHGPCRGPCHAPDRGPRPACRDPGFCHGRARGPCAAGSMRHNAPPHTHTLGQFSHSGAAAFRGAGPAAGAERSGRVRCAPVTVTVPVAPTVPAPVPVPVAAVSVPVPVPVSVAAVATPGAFAGAAALLARGRLPSVLRRLLRSRRGAIPLGRLLCALSRHPQHTKKKNTKNPCRSRAAPCHSASQPLRLPPPLPLPRRFFSLASHSTVLLELTAHRTHDTHPPGPCALHMLRHQSNSLSAPQSLSMNFLETDWAAIFQWKVITRNMCNAHGSEGNRLH